ncbi:FtsK/SpoIIIE domain-containing protein [Stackebrandtia albiflava]|uniref:FtsK/SpoIIIE domain-containing protein n=1 Tax=Stackebrandtia albiflava TaxID=406432 RepID=UPI00131546F8
MRDRPSRPWHRRLRVPLGVREDGTPLALDLKEPAQGGMGPHGLYVGGHAADGNPVVRTVLSGLTASHSPDELALLLLGNDSDAGFARYAALPHATTVVAGLRSEPAAVRHARDAMSTALDARRRLLDDKDSTTHTDYETARLAGEPLPPLPSLLVVVDGFSDLVGANPDLLATLVALGRSGRALGVHLLAVTDGMEPGRVRGLDGFLSYRIAMRTRDETESRIAIGVPDAHRLPEAPGHAYLRHGTEALVPFRLEA